MIPWILRQDLEVFPADEGNGTWTIKDPVRLTYFRVDSEELEFLRMLNGRQSLEAAVEKLMQTFPDLQFAAANLGCFLTVAIRSGLLIPIGPGYGQQLAETARTARSSAIPRKFFSLISHRFRGIDPTRLLQALDRRLGWIFRRGVLIAAVKKQPRLAAANCRSGNVCMSFSTAASSDCRPFSIRKNSSSSESTRK